MSAGVRCRALKPSMTTTRGSLRSVQSICPCPTSSATTRGGAALQQDVGEPAGRGADVEALAPVDGDAEGVERVRELQAAAADVGMVGRDAARPRVGIDRRCRPWSPAGRRRAPGRRGSAPARARATARGPSRRRADRGRRAHWACSSIRSFSTIHRPMPEEHASRRGRPRAASPRRAPGTRRPSPCDDSTP